MYAKKALQRTPWLGVLAGIWVWLGACSSAKTTKDPLDAATDAASNPGATIDAAGFIDADSGDQPAAIMPPVVPPPPPALVMPAGTEAEQAKALAVATAASSEGALAAWLTVYRAVGVPVIGVDTIAIDDRGTDPVGPEYWMVWMVSSAARPGVATSLNDAMKPLSSAADGLSVATALVADLTSAVQSSNAHARFLALFVLQKLRLASHGIDPLSPAGDVPALRVDLGTSLLLQWVALRATFFSIPPLAKAEAQSKTESATTTYTEKANALTGAPPPCAENWGTENETFIVNFLVNQGVLGGLPVPGLSEELPSLVTVMQKVNPHLIDADALARVRNLASKANVAAAVLSLLLQYLTLDLDTSMDPVPFERTKKAGADGKQGQLHFKLSVDPDKLPDGNSRVVCGASFLLNALGISFSFPAKGPVIGAELEVTGEQGFADRLDTSASYVLFADFDQLKQKLDDNGESSITVLGRRQRTELPDDSPPWNREFSVVVAAQPEPLTGRSLFSTFFDSLTFGGKPSALGIVAPAIDIIKTVHWDFGEQFLPIVDWRPSLTISHLIVDERAGTLKLVGDFGNIKGRVTADGQELPVQSWATDNIVCTLFLTGRGSNGDVIVEVPDETGAMLRSNRRQLTEWDIPIHYSWIDVFDLAGWSFEGHGNFRYRADVESYPDKETQSPIFPVRGLVPTLDSSIAITGSGSTPMGRNCAWVLSGSGTFPVPRDPVPLLALSWMKIDTKSGMAALNLGLGIAAGASPFPVSDVGSECPPPGSHASTFVPVIGLLEDVDAFPSPLDDGSPPLSPLASLTLSLDAEFTIQKKTFTDKRGGGTITVEWQNDIKAIAPPTVDSPK